MTFLKSWPRASPGADNPSLVSQLDCWCDEGHWDQCFRTPRFGLLRCSACGCYRLDPIPVNSDEEASEFYDDYYVDKPPENTPQPSPVDRTRTSRFWRVVEHMPDLAEVQQTVADIGCGEGILCGELAAHGWPSVTGLDVSRSRIARAKRQYKGIEFFDCPLDQTPIEPASLDLAVTDNVIEHLPRPVAMLKQIRRYLTRHGRCVVMTPNMESGFFRLLGRRWTSELAPHAHIFLFTPASLRQILEQAGFEVQKYGSFHPEEYASKPWLTLLRSSNVKEAAFRGMQAGGSLYSRLIGHGGMLYAVARGHPDR